MNDEFKIDTPEKAAWAMRKFRRLAQRAEQNNQLAKKEHDRIDAWVDRVNASLQSQAEFYYAHLSAYGMQQRAEGRKTVDLPDGVIKTRVKAQRVILDKSAFVQWAIEAERLDLLRTKYEPDMDAIESRIVVESGTIIDTTTGEMLPHAEVSPESVGVTITPDLEAEDIDDMEDEDA